MGHAHGEWQFRKPKSSPAMQFWPSSIVVIAVPMVFVESENEDEAASSEEHFLSLGPPPLISEK
jgi:hypothetical protein